MWYFHTIIIMFIIRITAIHDKEIVTFDLYLDASHVLRGGL